MPNVKLYIGTEQADFNEKFNVVFSIGDIRDITCGNNNKTYTLNLPLTKTNKRLLKFINQPDIKTEVTAKAWLYLNDLLVIYGTLTVTDTSDYSVKVIIKSDDWIEDLKALKLTALDLSAHDHALTHANVENSWTAVYPAYRYPMIDFGGLQTLETGTSAKWLPTDFIPMISVVTLISAILAPKTVVSKWMALAFVKDLFILGRETIAADDFLRNKALSVKVEAASDNLATGSSDTALTVTLTKTVEFKTITTDEGSDFSSDTDYTVPVTGTYRFICSMTLINTADGNGSLTITDEQVTLEIKQNGTAIKTVTAAPYTGTELINAVPYSADTFYVHCTAADVITVAIMAKCVATVTSGTQTITISTAITSTLVNSWGNANLYPGLNKNISLEEMLPDMSQLDFLSAIKDIFNLRFWYDKMKRVVYIEPWDSFVTKRITSPESSLTFISQVALPVMIRNVERTNEPWTGGTRWQITAHDTDAKSITFDRTLPAEIADFGTDVQKRWQVQNETAGGNVQITSIDWANNKIFYTTLRGTMGVGTNVTFWNPFRTFKMNPFTAVIGINAWATTYVSPGGVWLHSDGLYRMIVNGWDSSHGMTGLYKSTDLVTWVDCTGAFYYHANTHPFHESWCVGAATHWTYGSPVKIPGTSNYAKAFQGLNAAGRGEVGIVIFDEDFNIVTMPTDGIDVPGYTLDADHHYYPGGMVYFNGELYLTIRYRNTTTAVDKILIMKLDSPTTYVCSDVEEVGINTVDTYYEQTLQNACPFVFNNELYVWAAGENASADAPIGPSNMLYGLFYKSGGVWTPHAQNPIIANPMYGENVYSGCDYAIDHMGTSLCFFQTNNILHLFVSMNYTTDTYKVYKMEMTLFEQPVVDLTDYVDFESIEQELVSKNYSKLMTFKFRDDSSDEAYNEYLKTALSPGRKQVTLSSVYTTPGEEIRESAFSSIVAGWSYLGYFIMPRIWDTLITVAPTIFKRKVGFNTRIVEWKGLTAGATFKFEDDTKTTYPKIQGLDFSDVTNPIYSDYWLRFVHHIDKGKMFTVRMKLKTGMLTEFLTVVKSVESEAFRPTYQITINNVDHYFFLQKIISDGDMAELELILKT